MEEFPSNMPEHKPIPQQGKLGITAGQDKGTRKLYLFNMYKIRVEKGESVQQLKNNSEIGISSSYAEFKMES